MTHVNRLRLICLQGRWDLSGSFSETNLDLIGVWFGENQKVNIIKTCMFKIDWTTSSSINNYSTLDSEHNQEDLRIQIKISTSIHFQWPRQYQGRSTFRSGFCKYLLMQHTFCCVHLLGRKLENMENRTKEYPHTSMLPHNSQGRWAKSLIFWDPHGLGAFVFTSV